MIRIPILLATTSSYFNLHAGYLGYQNFSSTLVTSVYTLLPINITIPSIFYTLEFLHKYF